MEVALLERTRARGRLKSKKRVTANRPPSDDAVQQLIAALGIKTIAARAVHEAFSTAYYAQHKKPDGQQLEGDINRYLKFFKSERLKQRRRKPRLPDYIYKHLEHVLLHGLDGPERQVPVASDGSSPAGGKHVKPAPVRQHYRPVVHGTA